jgi:hypothetical protein
MYTIWPLLIALYFTATVSRAQANNTHLTNPIRLNSFADSDTLSGHYKTILKQESSNFYQFADIHLRGISSGDGHLKISANVKIYLGDRNSNEYLTYEFDDCPFNLITRQITIRNEKNDISLVGNLKQGGVFEGKWYASASSRSGLFESSKNLEPVPPENGQVVRSLTGYYRGSIQITNPEVNLPDKISMSFVSTQDSTTSPPTTKISGKVRFYLGDYDGTEFEELKFADVQFNFYSRFLTAKTEAYGITFKGTMSLDGTFSGVVLTDSNGQVGNVTVKAP